MKINISKCLDVAIESINYIVVNYALSNMAMFFRSSPLYILFFASEIWVTANYWQRILGKTENKIISALLLICCFSLHAGMVCFIGYISGTLIPLGQP